MDNVLDYDRIAVLDTGSLVEFDTPAALLGRESAFKALEDHSSNDFEGPYSDPFTSLGKDSGPLGIAPSGISLSRGHQLIAILDLTLYFPATPQVPQRLLTYDCSRLHFLYQGDIPPLSIDLRAIG